MGLHDSAVWSAASKEQESPRPTRKTDEWVTRQVSLLFCSCTGTRYCAAQLTPCRYVTRIEREENGSVRTAIERRRWCGRVDSNHHGIATASPSSWCVCQFRHDRAKFSITRISRRVPWKPLDSAKNAVH